MHKTEELNSDESTSHPSIIDSQLRRLHIQKLRQIVLAIISCFLLLSTHLIYIQKYDTVAMLIVACLLMEGCFYIAKHKNQQLGTSTFMSIISFACCYLMWMNEGLTDESVLGLPCILIISSLIASFRLTLILLILFVANILAIAYVNESGLYVNAGNMSNLSSGIQLSVILVLSTFTVYMISRDLHHLLKKLEKENYKVSQSHAEIMRLRNHDALTDLPNRLLAQSFYQKESQRLLEKHCNIAILLIDLDNFKSINDTLGHAAGDDYLKQVSMRLKEYFEPQESIFHLSSDEFMVIMSHVNVAQDASLLAECLLNIIKQAAVIENNNISLSASIGIALSPDDGVNFEELSRKADIAMRVCKEAGRNNFQFFDDDMETNNIRRMRISNELTNGISEQQFSVVYQSKHALDSQNIFGAEALLRWSHPTLGNISPVEFIPIAESNGVINELGEWVLETAIKACRNWHDLGYNDVSIAVNVSPIQFSQDNFDETVKQLLMKYRLGGQYLILELTESIFLEADKELLNRIHMITALGVRLAIDDFGTGYSNLAYLQKFDISILKIDRSFVSKMLNSKQDLAIVEAIIQMSKSLALLCLAEGVEERSELDTLASLFCEDGQGYFWSKPVPEQQFIALLDKQGHSSATS